MANNENTKEQDILKETQEAEQPAPEETAAPEDAAAPTEEPVGEEPAQEPDKTAAALERAKKALAAQRNPISGWPLSTTTSAAGPPRRNPRPTPMPRRTLP